MQPDSRLRIQSLPVGLRLTHDGRDQRGAACVPTSPRHCLCPGAMLHTPPWNEYKEAARPPSCHPQSSPCSLVGRRLWVAQHTHLAQRWPTAWLDHVQLPDQPHNHSNKVGRGQMSGSARVARESQQRCHEERNCWYSHAESSCIVPKLQSIALHSNPCPYEQLILYWTCLGPNFHPHHLNSPHTEALMSVSD